MELAKDSCGIERIAIVNAKYYSICEVQKRDERIFLYIYYMSNVAHWVDYTDCLLPLSFEEFL